MLKCLQGHCDSRSDSEPVCKLSVISGDEGVEVGADESAREATDKVDLDFAASWARFASIASL